MLNCKLHAFLRTIFSLVECFLGSVRSSDLFLLERILSDKKELSNITEIGPFNLTFKTIFYEIPQVDNPEVLLAYASSVYSLQANQRYANALLPSSYCKDRTLE
ncbi:hypothetical protein NPIL_323631 [Nephila pilipes]|uniref:Uncharacterized protein n=1 Tax=Nephila pilipes TaxID=299642 RepID=A0A8X6UU85_NEPPI|nr:hypothetical protein NPIL_323631 [Nephila pilipes]